MPHSESRPGSSEAEEHRERRSERRLLTLLRTAKLHLGVGETICRLRNVSATGFMADACPAPAPGERIALEVDEGRRLAARVVWSRAEQIGAEFERAQDVAALIGRGSGTARRPARAVRIRPDNAFANIICDHRLVPAALLNISQSGVALAPFYLDGPLPRRDALRLDIDGLPPMKSVLCWSASDKAGFRFAEPIPFEALAHWLWTTSLAARVGGAGEVSPARRRA